MAWSCGAESNAGLVRKLRAALLVQSDRVEAVMLATDRRHYVPSRFDAYDDCPQPIGHAATISAPHMHAMALELLAPRLVDPGCTVLDVGCGSGYLTACLQRLVAPLGGTAVGIDSLEPLVTLAKDNVRRDAPELLQELVIECADGWQGLAARGPFDAIHVGAAAASVPRPLVQQLKAGGRMVIPVGAQDGAQQLLQVDKASDGEAVSEKVITGVRYVPLVRY